MTIEVLLLAVTALVALVAVVAAVIALRAVREIRAAAAEPAVVPLAGSSEPVAPATELDDVPAVRTELSPRVVEGRVIVPPTQSQVVRTALGRPGIRLSVFAHGLAHALRAENRDRIVALMRREFVHRRKQRLRAGKQAMLGFEPTASPSTDRLGALPAATLDSRSGGDGELLEPRPLSLAERMINS